MSNRKVSELPTIALTNPDDLILVTVDPAGTPESRALESQGMAASTFLIAASQAPSGPAFGAANALGVALSPYGGLYVEDNTTGQAGVGTTPTKVTQFDSAMPSSGIVPNAGTSDLTLEYAGIYRATYQVVVDGSNNREWAFALYVDGVLVPGSKTEVTTTGSGDYISAGASVAFNVPSDSLLMELRAARDSGSGTLTVRHGQMMARRIG